MYFENKTKLIFGPVDEEPELFIRKLQAISNLAVGWFESNAYGEDESPSEWRLSDFFSANKLPKTKPKKAGKAKNSKQRKKKSEIIKNNEFRYGIDAEEENNDLYSDMYLEPDDDFNLLDDKITMEEKEKFYFGSKAKAKFWELYKSGRVFKDNMNSDIKDPRFAYLKDCYKNGMLPKVGLVIRGEKTSHLSFANQSLLQKNTKAVWESLKRYPLEINSLDFTGNGIKGRECSMIWESIDSHIITLTHLNFSNNKIGTEGAEALCERMKNMKNLESLNLNGNLLGDDTCGEIMKVINGLLNVKSLSFADNALGNKVTESEFIEQLCLFLKTTNTLVKLDLSWNNFRGAGANTLLESFKENYSLKILDLSYNLFGVAGGDSAPSIVKFVEVLQENHILEEVDLSNNLLDSNAAFYLSQGLKTNTTLKSFQISGNPLGSTGVKYLFQSLNENKEGKIKNLELKNTDTIIQDKKTVFDPTNFEKDYRFDLSQINDRAILYHLLDIDEKMMSNSSEEVTRHQGECFQGARLGGSSWTPPKDKDNDGKWNLGEDPKDVLTFKFTLNPSQNAKDEEDEPSEGTSVDPSSLQKPLIPDEVLEK